MNKFSTISITFNICLKLSIVIVFLSISLTSINSQVKTPEPLLKWTTWGLLQALPSVNFYEDRNIKNTALRRGFEWQVTPLSYSFNTNKYISHFSFFFIRPVKRFTGSAELFFQPEYVFGGFKYLSIKRFMFKSGVRAVFPLAHGGEYLSFSLGTGINYQKKLAGCTKITPTYEACMYSFFGMMGLKFNYNPNSEGRYSFGLYIKYY